ncbi:hypothetical protein [Actinomadura gamaensis]|uniref:Uncharacterized protein n=1 Tax=Actinomadura gamaensis TaxID=1763541 RepID=A0ABV9TTM1_9ACTN
MRRRLEMFGAVSAWLVAAVALGLELWRVVSAGGDWWAAEEVDRLAAPLVVFAVLAAAAVASLARWYSAAALCAAPALTQVLAFVAAWNVRLDRPFGYLPMNPTRPVDRWSTALTLIAAAMGLVAAVPHLGQGRGRPRAVLVSLPGLVVLAMVADHVAASHSPLARVAGMWWKVRHYGWIALGAYCAVAVLLFVARKREFDRVLAVRIAGTVGLLAPLCLLLWERRPDFLRINVRDSHEIYGLFIEGDSLWSGPAWFLSAAGGMVLWTTLVLAALIGVCGWSRE